MLYRLVIGLSYHGKWYYMHLYVCDKNSELTGLNFDEVVKTSAKKSEKEKRVCSTRFSIDYDTNYNYRYFFSISTARGNRILFSR